MKLFKRFRRIEVAPEMSNAVLKFCDSNKIKKNLRPALSADRAFMIEVSAKSAREILEKFGEDNFLVHNPTEKESRKKRSKIVYANTKVGKTVYDWLSQNKVKHVMKPSDRPNFAFTFALSSRAANRLKDELKELDMRIEDQ